MYILPPFDEHFDPWKHNRYMSQIKKKKCADENVRNNKERATWKPSLTESGTEYKQYKTICSTSNKSSSFIRLLRKTVLSFISFLFLIKTFLNHSLKTL